MQLSVSVYLDRYGDCSRGTYFPVNANDEFTILSHGGEAFDTLRCEITFKSEADDRLCLHFRNFFISRCDVKLEVYPEQSASGKVLVSTCTVPVKNQQHIPLFSEDPKLFFSEKER